MDDERQILSQYLPPQAVESVLQYVKQRHVHLHIVNKRSSKLGDYRWPQKGSPQHRITINSDLNPYMFLLVFLHEAAHLETRLAYGGSVQPHGHEWQRAYAALMLQHLELFPSDVQPALRHYASRIPLSTQSRREVEGMLKHYGEHRPTPTLLDDLPAGSTFRVRAKPDIVFRSEQRRRTRWICTDTASGRQYLVPGGAEVELA